MLVKLGGVWADPARIEFLEPYVKVVKNPDDTLTNIPLISIITSDRISESGGDIDTFATIVNDSLSPKQSWSEEVSEPEK